MWVMMPLSTPQCPPANNGEHDSEHQGVSETAQLGIYSGLDTWWTLSETVVDSDMESCKTSNTGQQQCWGRGTPLPRLMWSRGHTGLSLGRDPMHSCVTLLLAPQGFPDVAAPWTRCEHTLWTRGPRYLWAS